MADNIAASKLLALRLPDVWDAQREIAHNEAARVALVASNREAGRLASLALGDDDPDIESADYTVIAKRDALPGDGNAIFIVGQAAYVETFTRVALELARREPSLQRDLIKLAHIEAQLGWWCFPREPAAHTWSGPISLAIRRALEAGRGSNDTESFLVWRVIVRRFANFGALIILNDVRAKLRVDLLELQHKMQPWQQHDLGTMIAWIDGVIGKERQ